MACWTISCICPDLARHRTLAREGYLKRLANPKNARFSQVILTERGEPCIARCSLYAQLTIHVRVPAIATGWRRANSIRRNSALTAWHRPDLSHVARAMTKRFNAKTY